MDHPVDPFKPFLGLSDNLLHLVEIGNICIENQNLGAMRLKRLQLLNLQADGILRTMLRQPSLPLLSGRKVGTASQHQSGSECLCQMFGERHSNAPKSACDQVDSLFS